MNHSDNIHYFLADSSIDIGNVGIEGAVVTNSAGQFTVTGSGEGKQQI